MSGRARLRAVAARRMRAERLRQEEAREHARARLLQQLADVFGSLLPGVIERLKREEGKPCPTTE